MAEGSIVRESEEDVIEAVVVLGEVAVEVAVVVPSKSAADIGSLDKKALVRFSEEQLPAWHGSPLQQPRNGGFVDLQVKKEPVEHS